MSVAKGTGGTEITYSKYDAGDRQPQKENIGQADNHRGDFTLAAQSLQDVRGLNQQAPVPAAFGNLEITTKDERVEVASNASSTAPQPGHIRIPIPPGGIVGDRKPGQDCGPITLYPGQNGGVVVDIKPGPNGCTIYDPRNKH